MPIYEYRCKECEKVFEDWQSGFEEQQVPCPECGAQSSRIISNTTFVLKGSGWYVTDYADKRSSSNNGAPGSSESPATNGKAKDNGLKNEMAASDQKASSTSSDSAAASPAPAKPETKASTTQASS